ncbi:GTP-binding protein [Paraburkholderia sp. C35]|uniref:CobW family GTP-binding protein n=1 Tax=Paraburkholderia sp. C35 TaxID=2126993 RepID=UPI000D692A64|nr:GTP-binding protein [Paraburkholderia sp. C35]
MDRIPVTLLTGFLGSGKTTLLNRLVQQPEMANALVLINEFGEVGLDHLLVEHGQEDVVIEMSSGCLCCTIRGDLVDTLRDVYERFVGTGQRRIDRVIIETTGLADPAPIVHTFAADRHMLDHYQLDGMVTTVDARNGESTLDAHVEAVKQAAMADRLLLTKVDLVAPAILESLCTRLHAINPGAGIIRASFGDVSVSRLIGLGLFSADGKIGDVRRWLAEEQYIDHAKHHHHDDGICTHECVKDHDHHHHDVNRHDDEIRAFCFVIDDPVPDRVLTEWLDMLLSLMGPSMLRIKGILNVKGLETPVVIHGVQHVFHPLQQLDAWPDDDRRSRIVFITRAVERATIEETFRLFGEVAAIRAGKDHE